MSDPNMRLALIKKPTSEAQMLALYGGILTVLREILDAYAEALGPDNLVGLIALKMHLFRTLENQGMSGIPAEERARVIEILLTLLETAYPGIEIDGERIM